MLWEVAGQQFVFLKQESHWFGERRLLNFCKRMKRGQIELSGCCDGQFSGLQKWVNFSQRHVHRSLEAVELDGQLKDMNMLRWQQSSRSKSTEFSNSIGS